MNNIVILLLKKLTKILKEQEGDKAGKIFKPIHPGTKQERPEILHRSNIEENLEEYLEEHEWGFLAFESQGML